MGNESAMYAIVIIAVILFAVLIVISYNSSISTKSYTTTITQTNQNQISITASGTGTNKSTQAQVQITVNGTGATSSAATKNISTALAAFNSTVYKFVNGNLTLITTSNYNVYKGCAGSSGGYYPSYPSPSCNSTVNYVSTESIMVRLPNINNVSAFIGAVSSIPNVYVTYATPVLSNSQISMLRIIALHNALSNATMQAQALIGQNNTITSTNISVNNYYYYPQGLSIASNAAGNNTTPIGPQFYGGTNQVTESITAMFYYIKK